MRPASAVAAGQRAGEVHVLQCLHYKHQWWWGRQDRVSGSVSAQLALTPATDGQSPRFCSRPCPLLAIPPDTLIYPTSNPADCIEQVCMPNPACGTEICYPWCIMPHLLTHYTSSVFLLGQVIDTFCNIPDEGKPFTLYN